MIRNCKNCSGRITYDIKKDGLVCEKCGSFFKVEEYNSDASDISMTKLPDGEFGTMDVIVYSCSTCGAEVSVSDEDYKSDCIYCGNPTFVFSRKTKIRRPDKIIPFKLTKDDAEAAIRKELRKGIFIPKEIKQFQPDLLRPIYVPYYISKVEYDTSMVIAEESGHGEDKETNYFIRSGYATLDFVSTDACHAFNDQTSERLEPYKFSELRDFDEDYLLGFYSNIPDVEVKDAAVTAEARGSEFVDHILRDGFKSSAYICKQRTRSEVYAQPTLALFPVWFMTFKYQDQQYTIIVNGQTGKVVGGFPWRKMFATITAVVALILTALIATPLYMILSKTATSADTEILTELLLAMAKIIIPVGAAAIAVISAGLRYFKKVSRAIDRTTEESLFKFASKRKGGA